MKYVGVHTSLTDSYYLRMHVKKTYKRLLPQDGNNLNIRQGSPLQLKLLYKLLSCTFPCYLLLPSEW